MSWWWVAAGWLVFVSPPGKVLIAAGGARLLLRGHRQSDLESHAAMLGDPAVARHLGGHPHGREDSWRRLLAARGAWDLLGYGYWAVERKEDGAYIGLCGFADYKRDMTPSIEGLPEMGWIFDRSLTNQQRFTPDLLADPDMRAVHRWFTGLTVLSLGAPPLIATGGRPPGPVSMRAPICRSGAATRS